MGRRSLKASADPTPGGGRLEAAAPAPGQPLPGAPGVTEAAEACHTYAESLPDLIDAAEYPDHPDGRLVRVRITITEAGVEVLGDAFRPTVIEDLFAALGGGPTEQMLCG
jgi:hypothetical protein